MSGRAEAGERPARAPAPPPRVRVTPVVDGPVLPSASAPIGAIARDPAARHANVNGPCLVRVPDWVEAPLGAWYLYFADHKGDRIELAYADRIEGPWRVHPPGALHLRDTPFLQTPPPIPDDVDRASLAAPRGVGVPSVLDDCTIPHIASPEIVVDDDARRIRLYYHGLDGFARQVTRVAVSHDGLAYVARPEVLGAPYMRVFRHREHWYGLAMPGRLYRSADGLGDFEEGPTLFGPQMRHAGLWPRGDELLAFWTRVGDAPERILLSRIELRRDWREWRASEPIEVRRPMATWEGADQPIAPSLRSAVDRPVHQLRDPDVFVEGDGTAWLAWAVAGESGIAIGRLTLGENPEG